MNAQRLKHAFARGAQMQSRTPGSTAWYSVNGFPPDGSIEAFFLRTAPKDAHLEYGPLSTALRNAVITDDFDEYDKINANGSVDAAREMFYVAFGGDPLKDAYWHNNDHGYCQAKLFFAEYLADEGL